MTPRQAKLVEIIKADAATIGKTKTKSQMLKEAGYAKSMQQVHAARVLGSKAIVDALRAAGITQTKLFSTLAEGLEATTLYGKEALEHPDYSVRHKYMMSGLQLYGYGVNNSGLHITANNIGIMFGNGRTAVEKGRGNIEQEEGQSD